MEEKYKQARSNCIKVVLFGPESTGKTTLSSQLAAHYNTEWVPEFAREYLQNKWDEEREICQPEDLLVIAEGQIQLENELAKKTDTILICDTDLLETKVYSEAYYEGTCHPIIEKYALQNTYDLYFLTYIDTPWEADDLRDKPDDRKSMFKAFENALIEHKRPYVILKGSQEKRLQTAIGYIDKFLNKKNIMFTEKDVQQIKNHGLTVEKVNAQIKLIKSGMTYSNLLDVATIGNGILRKNDEQRQDYINFFEMQRNQLSIIKFVPASGAATRMFKFLFQFLKEYSVQESITSYSEKNKDITTFLNGVEKFPFYDIVRETVIENTPNFDTMALSEKCVLFVKTMLDANQLNYSFYPKGLLPFHKYETKVATAFQEHLLESTLYASSNHKANLHFTVSEVHKNMFDNELKQVKEDLEKEIGTSFNVSYSFQSKSTDTIAITATDELYRTEDDKLLFRPSGHGALIENLNTLDYDLIFIKNIDNIVVLEQNIEISNHKKMLAGILLQIQKQAFKYLNNLEDETISEDEVNNIELFVINRINVDIPEAYKDYTLEDKRIYLHNKLNRPFRVCGMVKNEGEPGGGPFWVKDENGVVSLQIVEFAQIDIENQLQKNIAETATHFNPTDLVCGVKNYKGEKFDLTKYVDPNAAFITMKSQNGVDIKALELPGLWNGSMAHWNSIFVEIPVSTFNPVKTVNDLLKPAHQI